MIIDQIENEISKFPVPGRKMNLLLGGASPSSKKTCLLPGIAYFLSTGDVSGESLEITTVLLFVSGVTVSS